MSVAAWLPEALAPSHALKMSASPIRTSSELRRAVLASLHTVDASATVRRDSVAHFADA
jgi:hypothetical protein